MCDARPDIIVDDCPYVIKTVQRPKGEITKQKDRLLGYVALGSHHTRNPVDSSPNIQTMNKVGYLFPLSLSMHEVDVSEFNQKKRESFITAIGKIRNHVEEQVIAGRKVLREGMSIIPLTVGRISTLRQEMFVKRGLAFTKIGKYHEAKQAFFDAIEATDGRPQGTKATIQEALALVDKWEEFTSMAQLYTSVGLLVDTIDFEKQFWELLPST